MKTTHILTLLLLSLVLSSCKTARMVFWETLYTPVFILPEKPPQEGTPYTSPAKP